MNKTIVIVEGPSGAGKTTFIGKMLDMGSAEGSIDSVKCSFSDKRLPTNVVHSALSAVKNDVNKLLTATLMFLERPELEIVFIDRLIVSQMVYHDLRTDLQQFKKRSVRFSISEAQARLMAITNFVNLLLPSYMTHSLNFKEYPELNIAIDLKLIVPDWDELQRRRATSTREYPAGRTDHQLYEYLFCRAGTDYIQRLGQLVL